MTSKATKITPAVTPILTETCRKVTSCASLRARPTRITPVWRGEPAGHCTFVLPTIRHRRRVHISNRTLPVADAGIIASHHRIEVARTVRHHPVAIVRYGKGHCRSWPCNYPACLFPDNSLPARHRYIRGKAMIALRLRKG